MESHPKPSVYSEALLHPQDSNGSALNLVFLDQYTEADVSSESEWLSNFVEECLSSAGSGNYCLPPSKDPQNLTTTITNPNSFKPNNHQNPQKQHSIPGKPRSQRGRKPSLTKTHKTPLFRWPDYNSQSAFTDPPLLEQGHWLADSELLSMPRKEEEEQKKVEKEESEEGEDLLKQQQQQQSRRCSHCQSQKTPQWRAGPMGPKTLCNACGMRYFKSGRLLPEYRPAKSPTFLSYKHSNSHKKVLQMRMALISSSTPLLQ